MLSISSFIPLIIVNTSILSLIQIILPRSMVLTMTAIDMV